MKKVLIPLLLLFLLFTSCATYTISEARESISYPESGTTETRIRVINEKKAAEEAEKARKEEEERINVYPEDLTALSLPFYYNPVKQTPVISEDSANTRFSAVLIPLGEEEIGDDAISSIVSFLCNYNFMFVALTGRMENQTRLAEKIGRNAVTIDGGTIIFSNASLSSMTEDSAVFMLSENRSLRIYSEDFHPVVPEVESVDDALEIVDELEKKNAEDLIEKISSSPDSPRILFLTSIAPSSLDWTDWTEYGYRSDRSFLLSDMLLTLRWDDAFASSRFSEETEAGTTRTYSQYEERLDFIYSKGMIVLSSFVVPIENLPSSATVAYFLIP